VDADTVGSTSAAEEERDCGEVDDDGLACEFKLSAAVEKKKV
jgi:hypothetical protein